MDEAFLPKKATKYQFPFEELKMKENHENCPIWVNYDAFIILEMFQPNSKQVTDFITSIAEPVSRPCKIHEYQITAYSLYAATSIGLTTDIILSTLQKFSKNIIPRGVSTFITDCTLSYGKIKLVRLDGKFFIEAVNEEIYKMIISDPVIKKYTRSCSLPGKKMNNNLNNSDGCINSQILSKEDNVNFNKNLHENQIIDKNDKLNQNCKYDQDDNFTRNNIEKMSINENKGNSDNWIEVTNIEEVRKQCIKIDYPLIEEYDFNNDDKLDKLEIDLKTTTQIRSYQENCLNKMFSNGRARSGIIVLPCGSGKTLVGITAISTIKKSALIFCTSGVSVEQWRQAALDFTNIESGSISRFTSDRKEWFDKKSGILITTYSMISYAGKRSYEAQKIINQIQSQEWGIMVLDEVHVVPAQMFRKTVSTVLHHCKLGLTATLVREDDKIQDLNFLIGPKLYEADWQDLSSQGHIAKVEGAEVWCSMTGDFYKEYLLQNGIKRRILSIMNPTKFQYCEYLIDKHEKRGDKIIVFSDSVIALKEYAVKLGKPYIYGPTGQMERMRILKQFQTNPLINTIFLSKVGDTSIDLPEATCLIQISSHFGSRRQEAQRLGRVLRAKKRSDPNFRVYFYSLVSKDTEEMVYSAKRQQFLIDQGYSFNIITEIKESLMKENRVYRTKAQQRELLASILLASESDIANEESHEYDDCEITKEKLSTISGSGEMAYNEKFKKKKK